MPKFLPNKQSYKIPVFDGGLQTKWTDLSAPAHESPNLKQVEFTDVGAVGIARGYRKYNDTRIASYPVEGLQDYYDATNQTERLVAVCNGSVYAAASGTTAFSPVTGGTAVFTPGNDVCIRVVEDEAWMTSGYDSPQRYDGSEVLLVNPGTVDNSTYASGVSSTGGFITTGTFNYLLSGEDADGFEGNPVTITSDVAVSIGTGSIDLTDIPNFPASAGVQTKYLYRNTAAAGGVYYRVTALTASQTTYNDNNADSALVTQAVYTNDAPPNCKWWWYHRGRMFAAGDPDYPMRVYYSKQGTPKAWPSSNYLDIGKGDGFPITGLRIIGNALLVHKASPGGEQTALWMVYMPDSTGVSEASNWYITRTPSAYAAISDKTLAYVENMCAFLDRRGLYFFNGEQIAGGPAEAQAGQYYSESRSDNIEPDVRDWRKSILDKSAVIAYDDKLWLAVPGSTTSLNNDAIYVYDYSVSTKERGQGAWSKLNPLDINNFAVFGGSLVGGSATDGYVYELDSGYTADGDDLESYFYTMTIAGDKKHWDMTKIWRFLWITVDTPGSWDLDVTWWVDKSATETGSESVSLTGSGSEWDSAVWDSATWDSSTDRRTIRINLAGVVGRTIQFRFKTDSQDVWWALYRLEVEYNLRSRRN